MRILQTFKLQVALIFMVLFALISTGCPTKKNLVTAFNSSARISKISETTALALLDLYNQRFISLEFKDRAAAKLALVNQGNERAYAAMMALKARYQGNLSNIPKSEISALDLLFSREVLEPFLGLLTDTGVLPPATAERVMGIFMTLRVAILAISNIFGSRSVGANLRERIERFENYPLSPTVPSLRIQEADNVG